jgi:hypothetical protein
MMCFVYSAERISGKNYWNAFEPFEPLMHEMHVNNI